MVKSASKRTLKTNVANNQSTSPDEIVSSMAVITAEIQSPAAVTENAGSVPTPPNTANSNRISKRDIVLDLLRQEQGATLEQLCDATGWQKHSVRGFMSGTVKAKLKLELTSEKTDRGRVYKIVSGSPGEGSSHDTAVDVSAAAGAYHAA